VLAEIARVLRRGRYAVLIVRDAYQDGRYLFTGADLAARAAAVGPTPKGDLIWYQAGTRLRPYGYPTGFVPNIAHPPLPVLRRGRPGLRPGCGRTAALDQAASAEQRRERVVGLLRGPGAGAVRGDRREPHPERGAVHPTVLAVRAA